MAKLIKWSILPVILICGIGVAAVILFNPNNYKATIAELVADKLGRELTIAGDINLHYYPWLGVDIEDVYLSNAKGFSDEPFLQIKTMQVRAKLLSLLRLAPEFDTVVVKGVAINLEKNASGLANWDDLRKPATADTSGSLGDSLYLATLVLGQLDISDVNVSFRDQQQSVAYKFTDIRIQTDAAGDGSATPITAAANISSSTPALSVAAQLNGMISYNRQQELLTIEPLVLDALIKSRLIPSGQAPVKLSLATTVDLNNETAALNSVRLTALDTTLTGQLNAGRIFAKNPSVAGNLQLNSKNLTPLFQLAGYQSLAKQLAQLPDKSINLDTTFTAASVQEDMDVQLKWNILGNHVTANIKINEMQSKRPAAKGAISAGGANLPALVNIAAPFFNANKADLTALSRQLKSAIKPFELAADFDVNLKEGRYSVPTLSAKGLGMVIAGEIKSEGTSIAGELKASGSDFPLLLQLARFFQKQELLASARLKTLKNKGFVVGTRFNLDHQSGRFDMPLLAIEALSFKVDGQLQGNKVQSRKGNWQGSLTINNQKPKAFLQLIGQPELAEVLQSIELKTAIDGNITDLSLSPLVNVRFAGKQIPNSPTQLVMKAAANINVEKQQFNLDKLQLQGLGLNVQGDIGGKRVNNDFTVAGQLKVLPFDLQNLLKNLNQPAIKTSDPKALRKVAFSTKLSSKDNQLIFDDVELIVDETKLTAAINVPQLSPLAVDFSVKLDQLNLDRYLPTANKTKSQTKQSAAAKPMFSDSVIESLRSIKVNGEINLAQLVVKKTTLSAVKMQLHAERGNIKLDPIKATLHGGSYDGNVVLDVKNSSPALSVANRFNNINIGTLLTEFMDTTNITGTANVTLALNSTGRDTGALRKNLTGSGKLNVSQGKLKGINIGSVLRQIELFYEAKRIGLLDKGDETVFTALSGAITVKNGVITNDDLLMLSPGFRVNGQGTLLDLSNDSWRYDFTVSVDESSVVSDADRYNIGGYSLKVNCRGKITDKNCIPDIETVLTALLKNTLGRTVEKAIGLPLSILPGFGDEPKEKKSQAQPAQPKQAPKKESFPAEKLIEGVLDKLF